MRKGMVAALRRFKFFGVALASAAAAAALRGGPLEWRDPSARPLLDDPFLLWDATITLRTAGGYSDNPTFARVHRERSPFESLGADLLVLRLPTDGNSFHFFFTGEDRRNTSSASAPNEETFLSQAEWAHETGAWTWKLAAQHLYFDQVFDLSDQNLGFGAARAQGHALSLTPAVRRRLGGGWWVEAQGVFEREYLAAPLDSFRDAGPRLAAGLNYGADSSLDVSVGAVWRPYDRTPLLSASGDVLPGSNETLTSSAVAVRWKHHWGSAGRWTTQAQAAVARNEDNGQGYYNYDRAGGGLSVSYATGPWLWRASVRGAWYAFPVQPSNGAGSPPRGRHDFALGWRAERKLGGKTKAFAEAEAQRSFANTLFDSYHQTWILFGL